MCIRDRDNPAPRLLSRPGEGIYNDAAGAIEGNSPFQAVWLSDKTRDDYLAKIRARADQDAEKYPGPIVFEGNAPADVLENIPLRLALQKAAAQIPAQAGVWLGAPNSIKGPTEAVFRRQSGNNLLIVAQSEERTLTMVSIALVSLAAQFPKTGARFVVLDSTPPGFPQREFLQKVIQTVPQEIVQGSNSNLAEVMGGLAEELKRRTENELSGPDIFVLVQGLQNFKKLRQEDEFSFSGGEAAGAPNPAATLMSLITEGPVSYTHLATNFARSMTTRKNFFPRGTPRNGKTGSRRRNFSTRQNSRASKWTWRRLPNRCRRTRGWRGPARRRFPCRSRWSARRRVRFCLRPARRAATRRLARSTI